ncbi:MAG: FHA domain-containing protein, partial [Planctomycetaceae bacterium]|nr:FHA domain-containing protein [Planctomycetaceae bacterium]
MDNVDVLFVEPPPAPAKETGWYLFGPKGPGQPLTRVAVTSERFVIGRKSGMDLVLGSPMVSGRHAEILSIGEKLFVRDLNSRNGTFVNRARIEEATPIGPGDHIELADMEFRIEYRPSLVHSPPQRLSCSETIGDIDTLEADWMLSQLDAL